MDSTNDKTNQALSPLKFNLKQIISVLKKKPEFTKDTISIKKFQENNSDNKNQKYLITQKNNTFSFSLIVNNLFQRDDLCINTYANNDSYFGYFKEDKRNQNGFYSFAPQSTEKFKHSEYYYGSWENDLKNGNGIYLWLKEREKREKPFSSYKLACFKAYIGPFENDSPKKGVLLKKRAKDFYIYYGKFSKDFTEKHGKNCFYYSFSLKQIYFGKFRSGRFVNGFIGKLDENDKLEDMIKYYRRKIYEYENIPKEEIDKNSKIMNDFLNVIKSKDYFRMVYDEFKKISEVKNLYKEDIESGKEVKYEDINESLKGYNNLSICEDIEKNVKY